MVHPTIIFSVTCTYRYTLNGGGLALDTKLPPMPCLLSTIQIAFDFKWLNLGLGHGWRGTCIAFWYQSACKLHAQCRQCTHPGLGNSKCAVVLLNPGLSSPWGLLRLCECETTQDWKLFLCPGFDHQMWKGLVIASLCWNLCGSQPQTKKVDPDLFQSQVHVLDQWSLLYDQIKHGWSCGDSLNSFTGCVPSCVQMRRAVYGYWEKLPVFL